jgi:hypothetical protein
MPKVILQHQERFRGFRYDGSRLGQPTISASVSWLILGITVSGLPSLPNLASSRRSLRESSRAQKLLACEFAH